MVYTAIYRKKRNGSLFSITSEYGTKKDFERDCRLNAMIPIAILTDKEIKKIKEHDDSMLTKFKRLDYEYVRECL